VTPASYLELNSIFKKLLQEKRDSVENMRKMYQVKKIEKMYVQEPILRSLLRQCYIYTFYNTSGSLVRLKTKTISTFNNALDDYKAGVVVVNSEVGEVALDLIDITV
jgi:hypothetical protein